MRDFFAELRRRHVYKVAVFYAAGAWILIQLADIVFENFSASDQLMQGVILLLALGFPVALMLAWVYDLTPQGVAVTPRKDEPDTAPPQENSGIVVLPFDNFSGEPEDKVLSDGFTDDLTALLEHRAGFLVISRDSTYAYKDRHLGVREIAREPGVGYLLEGSLRRMGDQVRVTAQLVRADDGSHLWADNYDTNIENLQQVQDELLRNIALQLGVELAAE